MTVDARTKFICSAWKQAVKQINRNFYHLDVCYKTIKKFYVWGIAQDYQECENFKCIECMYKPLLNNITDPLLCSQRNEASGCTGIALSRITSTRNNGRPVVTRNIR